MDGKKPDEKGGKFMASIYVKFDTPEEIANKAEEALEVAQNTGKVAIHNQDRFQVRF